MTLVWQRHLRTVVVGAAAVVTAWHAYSFSAIPLLRLVSPDMALARSPNDAVSISKRVHARTVEAGKYVSNPEDVAAARRSLAMTPLSRTSLRIIGMDAWLNGRADVARAAMNLTHRVSRRDPWAETWLLEEAARTSDPDAILRHYHTAMSVNPELGPALTPVMVKATEFAELRAPLQTYLRNDAPWAPAFLAQAANDAALADVVAIARPVARHLGDDPYVLGMGRIVYRLAAAGQWNEAMQLSATAWPNFDQAEFERLDISAQSTEPRLGRLAWTLSNEGGIETFLDASNAVEVTLDPLSRGQIAARDIRLDRAGDHTFTYRIGFVDANSGVRLQWQADCVPASGGDSRKIWEQSIPASAAATTYRSTLRVPAGCGLLSLRLSGSGPEGGGAASVRISDLAFASVR